ncbi:hypothetical protein BC628DRAFT_79832 [Trametes gibbosa]|nr:hypothetical protein BC628DRAFT_79832 [Trametes gibbosa]
MGCAISSKCCPCAHEVLDTNVKQSAVDSLHDAHSEHVSPNGLNVLPQTPHTSLPVAALKDVPSNHTPLAIPEDASDTTDLPHAHCDITEQQRLSRTQQAPASTQGSQSLGLGPVMRSRANVVLTIPQSSPSMPPRPEFTPFTTPCLVSAEAPYDGDDFWTYPARHGWVVHAKDEACHTFCSPGLCRGDMERYRRSPDSTSYLPLRLVSRADGTPVTGTSKAAFLQGWLFFGVLTEVSALCGLAIDVREEFVVEDGRAISTAALNGLAGRWFASLADDLVGDEAFMKRILDIVRNISLLLNEELVDRENIEFEPLYSYTTDEARVFHAIDTLLRILALHLLLHVYSRRSAAGEEDAGGWTKGAVEVAIEWPGRRVEAFNVFTDRLQEEMLERGWCDSEISLLATDEIPFASLLDRPRIRDHSRCGDVVCSAYQTDEATYKTIHTDDSCQCAFLRVPAEDLAAYLARGKVPALLLTEDLEIQVVDSVDYPYIALSHVWADGLGNPVENALPTCELRRIRAYVDEVHRRLHGPSSHPGPVVLWMDTLCIPVDPSMKAHRKKAIELLGKTFNDARGVLVLDRELEIVDAGQASFLEVGIRMLCSGWIKRLWTLQEAVLASAAHDGDKLYFQMRDGPFLYEKYDRHKNSPHGKAVPEALAEEREFLCETGVILLLGEQIPSARAMRDPRKGWSHLGAVYDAIEHRTTSKAEDVPVCIASIMGWDVRPILAARDVEARQEAFYLLAGTVPDRVLWLERIETLRRAPFRWAPASLTVCPPFTFRKGDNAMCDARGLHVSYPGFLINVAHARGRHAVLPARFRLVSESGEADAPYGMLWPSLSSTQVPLEPADRLALIVRSSVPSAVEPNAAVVRIEREAGEDGEIVGTVIARMFFFETPPGARGVVDTDTVIQCQVISGQQKWCMT